MASIPTGNRINVPAWTALLRKFRAEPDTEGEVAEGLASEFNQLPTYADMKAELRALELRLVRWMIAVGALIIAANAAIEKLT